MIHSETVNKNKSQLNATNSFREAEEKLTILYRNYPT